MILVSVLIILLITLILLQLSGIFKRALKYIGIRFNEDVLEGLEDKDKNKDKNTDTNTDSKCTTGLNQDPLYLAKVNSADITYLKEQVDKLTDLKQQVNVLNSQVENNSTAITALGQQFNTTAQQVTGRSADSTEPIPSASGLE
jgi:hypothetical protein